MGVDVFISYRRADTGGYAFALFQALEPRYTDGAIFFDREAIEGGEDFPARIESGVRECKVFLAMIGPDWLDAADDSGRRRLDDPNDFVRREVALAFELGKVVIPVLFGGGAVAQPKQLPDVLRALSARLQQHAISRDSMDKFTADVDELVRLIGKLAGVTPARPRAAPAAAGFDPGSLTCLCDRSAQDEEVRDTIRAQMREVREKRRPFVLIVHGPTNEAHDAFVKRLEVFSVPRLLQSGGRQTPVKFLQVYNKLPLDGGQQRFDQRLRDAMADHLKLGAVDSDSDIVAEIVEGGLGAAIAVAGWRASEVSGDPSAPLKLMLDYWSRFPDVPAKALAGCLVWFRYDAPTLPWYSRIMGKRSNSVEALRSAVLASMQSRADDRVVWRVLPELPSVTLPDLSRWVTEVASLIGRGFHVPEKRLREISGGGMRPMDEVLPDLEELLPQA